MDYNSKYNGEQVEEKLDKVDKKQDELISGVNIKTINGESILGEGNIELSNVEPSGSDIESFIPLSRDFSDDFNNDYAR